MASGRMLKNSISLNERVNDLSIPAMLIYTWMISHADDFGRMRGGAKWVRGAVVPMRDDITVPIVEACLQEMQAKKLIQRYEVEGELYIQFPSWEEHQTGLHKRTKSKLPGPVPGISGKLPPSRACAEQEQNRTGTEQEQNGTERESGDESPDTPREPLAKNSTRKKTKTEIEPTGDVLTVLNHLNDKTGHRYGPTQDHVKLITDRFAEGYTVDDLKSVINLKTLHWITDPKMSQYLRPTTLFNCEKFGTYIGQARASPPAPDAKEIRRQKYLNGEIDSMDEFDQDTDFIEGEVIR